MRRKPKNKGARHRQNLGTPLGLGGLFGKHFLEPQILKLKILKLEILKLEILRAKMLRLKIL